MLNQEEYLYCQSLERNIYISYERLQHVELRHPELRIFKEEFRETIFRPEKILIKSSGELLLVRWHSNLFNGKFIVAVIKMDINRFWVITSFVSRKMPIGEKYEA